MKLIKRERPELNKGLEDGITAIVYVVITICVQLLNLWVFRNTLGQVDYHQGLVSLFFAYPYRFILAALSAIICITMSIGAPFVSTAALITNLMPKYRDKIGLILSVISFLLTVGGIIYFIVYRLDMVTAWLLKYL